MSQLYTVERMMGLGKGGPSGSTTARIKLATFDAEAQRHWHALWSTCSLVGLLCLILLLGGCASTPVAPTPQSIVQTLSDAGCEVSGFTHNDRRGLTKVDCK